MQYLYYWWQSNWKSTAGFRSFCIDLNYYIDFETVESQLLSLFAFPVVFMGWSRFLILFHYSFNFISGIRYERVRNENRYQWQHPCTQPSGGIWRHHHCKHHLQSFLAVLQASPRLATENIEVRKRITCRKVVLYVTFSVSTYYRLNF